MRILTVAQPESLLQGYRHLLGKAFLSPPQILRDGGVIASDMLERLLCQPLTLSHIHTALFQFGNDQSIIGGVYHYDDAGKVLGGGANHGWAANVNILQSLVPADALPGDRPGKRIQVNRHQVNDLDFIPG